MCSVISDIPSVEDFHIIGQVHSQSVKLRWIIPKEINDQKHLFYLVIQENNGLYKEKQISSDTNEINLKNLEECRTYNFKITVNYNGYSSRSKSIIVNTPEPGKYICTETINVHSNQLFTLSLYIHSIKGIEMGKIFIGKWTG